MDECSCGSGSLVLAYAEEMTTQGLSYSEQLYTKTIVFQDITYQLAQNEDKTQIFENYCDFLNFFDSTIPFQLSFINQYGNIDEFSCA